MKLNIEAGNAEGHDSKHDSRKFVLTKTNIFLLKLLKGILLKLKLTKTNNFY